MESRTGSPVPGVKKPADIATREIIPDDVKDNLHGLKEEVFYTNKWTSFHTLSRDSTIRIEEEILF